MGIGSVRAYGVHRAPVESRTVAFDAVDSTILVAAKCVGRLFGVGPEGIECADGVGPVAPSAHLIGGAMEVQVAGVRARVSVRRHGRDYNESRPFVVLVCDP